MSRHGGELTVDKVLQALAAMGTPTLMLDEPTNENLPYLLGCLLASTEAALCLADPQAMKLVTDGYRRQIVGPESGFVQALQGRAGLLAMQLKEHPVQHGKGTGAIAAAAESAMATGALLGVHVMTLPDRTGRAAEPALLSEMLREAKRWLGATRRAFDRVTQVMRGRGVDP